MKVPLRTTGWSMCLRKRKKKRGGGGVLGFMYRYFNFLNPNHKNKKKRGLSKVSLLGSVSSVGRALDSKKTLTSSR